MKDPENLNEREFELINIVGAQLDANQRDLSKKLDISLGMTNLLVRRLIAKGYIRIRQLNKKKSQYILTPKGFAEKYHKSIRYTLKTIRSIGLIRNQLNIAIKRFYDRGERSFLILGSSDLTELVEMALSQPQWAGVKFSRIEHIPESPAGVILICREKVEIPQALEGRYVDLIKELASQNNTLQEVKA